MKLATPLVVAGLAVGPWFNETWTPSQSHEAGEARWSDSLHSASRDRCAPPKSGMIEGTDHDFFNCTAYALYVRNEGSRPIQCRTVLELEGANFEGSRRIESVEAIFAGSRSVGAQSLGPSAALPTRYFSSCRLIPAEAPPAPPLPADCKSEVRGPRLEDYYPRSAGRQKQEGTVEIEYGLTERGYFEEVWIVRSSGFESLDSGALRYARALRARPSTNCKGQRFRYEVRFVLADVPWLTREPQWLQ